MVLDDYGKAVHARKQNMKDQLGDKSTFSVLAYQLPLQTPAQAKREFTLAARALAAVFLVAFTVLVTAFFFYFGGW